MAGAKPNTPSPPILLSTFLLTLLSFAARHLSCSNLHLIAMETSLELRLRQLVHRVDELHINLQRVSSRTLSNSRTTSLEDRLQLLEQGQIPETEPTISTQIFDDLTMQMNIFEKRMDSLEKRMEQYHKEFHEFQDYWFDEDKHNAVVTNAEMMQTIKLQCDRQAAKLKLMVDTLTTHKLWPPLSTADSPREMYPNFPKWRSSDTTASSSKQRRTTIEDDPSRIHQSGVADHETISLL